MNMTPGLRKFALTTHIATSVGWLGAVAAFLALAVAGMTSTAVQTARGVYLAMELIGWYVIVPMCLASLVTGLIQALGTKWGLLRHYWVSVKFLITVFSAIILFVFTKTLGSLAALANDPNVSVESLRNPSPIVHSGLALLVLLVTTVLSVFKPWGKIQFGRRKQFEQ